MQINRLLSLNEKGEADLIEPNKILYSAKANFDPLVGVVCNSEEGTVSPFSGLESYTEQEGYQYKATYGNPATFTITPTKAGYKPLVNGEECADNGDGTYTYTIENVTEPTTLKVEFEETEENIDVEDLGLGVKFECTDNDSHNSENIMLKVADKNTYYTISPVDGTTATVTIDANKYLENYNTTNPNHRLVSPSEEYKIQLTLVNNTWTVDEGSTTIVTIPVTCKAEVKQIGHIEINLGENLKKELKVDPLYLHAEYDGKYIFLSRYKRY